VFAELSVTWVDLFALGFFVVAWVGYARFAVAHGRHVPSLHNQMDGFRRDWMVRMIDRDNRMVDVNVLRNLTRSSQFFASTTMVILGALIALMGYVQKALDVVSELPFTIKGSERLLEIKILLMVMIFVYAFFKLSWSIRQFSFCSILIGAAPKQPEESPEQHASHINRIAKITSYASTNFNYGLRAYYFGMAALAWFLHPWLMIAATGWVVYILYHREFSSRTLRALAEEDTSRSLNT
jgi:uncharacterized membrane protein